MVRVTVRRCREPNYGRPVTIVASFRPHGRQLHCAPKVLGVTGWLTIGVPLVLSRGGSGGRSAAAGSPPRRRVSNGTS